MGIALALALDVAKRPVAGGTTVTGHVVIASPTPTPSSVAIRADRAPTPRLLGALVKNPFNTETAMEFGGVRGLDGIGDFQPFGDSWQMAKSPQSFGYIAAIATGVSDPSARFSHAMAYDEAEGYVVLFGGQTTETLDSVLQDTYIHAGVNWAAATPSGSPRARSGHAMAMRQNGTDQGVIVIGGVDADGTLLDDTVLFQGDRWVNILTASRFEPVQGHSATWCPPFLAVLIFGGMKDSGRTSDLTWAMAGEATTGWTELPIVTGPPPSRYRHGTAYCSGSSTLIVFGGSDGSGPGHCFGDTWSLNHSLEWELLVPPLSPSPREGCSMLSLDVGCLMYGGRDIDGNYLTDVWYFTNNDGDPIWSRIA